MICALRMHREEVLQRFGNISVSIISEKPQPAWSCEEKPGRYYNEVSGIYISIASKISASTVTVSDAINRGDTVIIGKVSGGFLYIQEMRRD